MSVIIWHEGEHNQIVIHEAPPGGGFGTPCIVIDRDQASEWFDALARAIYHDDMEPWEAPGKFTIIREE